MFLFYLVTGTL